MKLSRTPARTPRSHRFKVVLTFSALALALALVIPALLVQQSTAEASSLPLNATSMTTPVIGAAPVAVRTAVSSTDKSKIESVVRSKYADMKALYTAGSGTSVRSFFSLGVSDSGGALSGQQSYGGGLYTAQGYGFLCDSQREVHGVAPCYWQ